MPRSTSRKPARSKGRRFHKQVFRDADSECAHAPLRVVDPLQDLDPASTSQWTPVGTHWKTGVRPLPTLGKVGFYVSNKPDCGRSRHHTMERQLSASANSTSEPIRTPQRTKFQWLLGGTADFGGLQLRKIGKISRERGGHSHSSKICPLTSRLIPRNTPNRRFG